MKWNKWNNGNNNENNEWCNNEMKIIIIIIMKINNI